MFKFIFLMVLAGFSVIGILLCFADLGSVSKETVNTDYNNSPNNANPPKNITLDFLEKITTDCPDQKKECLVVKIYSNIKNNYATNRPLVKGQLAELGIPFKEEGDEIYACNLDVQTLYNEIKADFTQNPMAGRKAVLNKSSMWKVDIENKNSSDRYYQINARGTEKFDMLMFASAKDWNDYIHNRQQKYIFDCSVFDTTGIETTCAVKSGSVIAFISKNNNNIFEGNILKSGFSLKDINLKEFDSKICVNMELGF